jgi:hypothetical protein
LDKHVPGVHGLTEDKLEWVGHNFKIVSYPKGHIFIRQGTIAEERVFLVCKGAVDVQCQQGCGKAGKIPVLKKLSVVVEGGFFGSVTVGAAAPFTYRVSKGPCEVLEVCNGDFARLPGSVRHAIHKHLSEAARWHAEQSSTSPDVSLAITPKMIKCHSKATTSNCSSILLQTHAQHRRLEINKRYNMIPLAATGIPPGAIQEMRRCTSLPALTGSSARHGNMHSTSRAARGSHWSTTTLQSLKLPSIDMRISLK